MAIHFSAPGEYLTVGSTATCQNVAGATIMCWFITGDRLGNQDDLFYFSTGTVATNPRIDISILNNTNRLRISARRLDADSTVNLSSTINVPTTLTHVAGVCGFNTQSIRIYINGQLNNSAVIAGWTGNSSNTVSSAGSMGALSNGANAFDGDVEDPRVYHRALTDIEINNIYQSKGKDRNNYLLVHRYYLYGSPGQNVSGVVKDKGLLQSNASIGGGTPNWTNSSIIFPRSKIL